MPLVVGIRFKEKGKVYYFDPCELSLKLGDKVIVETVKGTEMGTVVTEVKEVPEEKLVSPLKRSCGWRENKISFENSKTEIRLRKPLRLPKRKLKSMA